MTFVGTIADTNLLSHHFWSNSSIRTTKTSMEKYIHKVGKGQHMLTQHCMSNQP